MEEPSRPFEPRCELCNARMLTQVELRDPKGRVKVPHACCNGCGAIQNSIETEDQSKKLGKNLAIATGAFC